MYEFIAEFGYTLAWGIGTPKYNLDEVLEKYYRFGLSILVIGGILMLIALILLINVLLHRKEETYGN